MVFTFLSLTFACQQLIIFLEKYFRFDIYLRPRPANKCWVISCFAMSMHRCLVADINVLIASVVFCPVLSSISWFSLLVQSRRMCKLHLVIARASNKFVISKHSSRNKAELKRIIRQNAICHFWLELWCLFRGLLGHLDLRSRSSTSSCLLQRTFILLGMLLSAFNLSLLSSDLSAKPDCQHLIGKVNEYRCFALYHFKKVLHSLELRLYTRNKLK